ncbi:MAG: hypothetical protein VXX88_08680 [Pseudomonadota bacterium]|nr:hypothetical protein [Pseudomonadota bacterium]MEC9076973.1 hypothetical protein [Pseudomonadota bacterium]
MHSFHRILAFSVLVTLSFALVGCCLTSEEILKATTPILCETVSSFTSVSFSKHEILAELKNATPHNARHKTLLMPIV